MESPAQGTTIEDRVRREFAAAWDALERAPAEEKPKAISRLNRAVRRLYDLVGHGKLPPEWRFNRSALVDEDTP